MPCALRHRPNDRMCITTWAEIMGEVQGCDPQHFVHLVEEIHVEYLRVVCGAWGTCPRSTRDLPAACVTPPWACGAVRSTAHVARAWRT